MHRVTRAQDGRRSIHRVIGREAFQLCAEPPVCSAAHACLCSHGSLTGCRLKMICHSCDACPMSKACVVLCMQRGHLSMEDTKFYAAEAVQVRLRLSSCTQTVGTAYHCVHVVCVYSQPAGCHDIVTCCACKHAYRACVGGCRCWSTYAASRWCTGKCCAACAQGKQVHLMCCKLQGLGGC
jgi:hypothetical protein